ncbi:MAG: hypothetical protein H6741_20345 [Alphaproteobacteria bacterium]|nr:hypothetical protein [Alphaproteobacteria bacterium]
MRRMLGLLLAAAPLLVVTADLSQVAIAAPSNATVLKALLDETGWARHAEHEGVTVYEKQISVVDMPAYKGVVDIDVDRELLWGLICDLGGQTQFSHALAASTVLAQIGEKTHYYQVTDTPMLIPISDRYWFNEAHVMRDHGGPGHHLRTWAPIDPTLYPEAYAAVTAKYPNAVYITTTYGYWEVEPLAGERTRLTYTSLTNPGGNVPDAVFESLAARSLPDNMMIFVNEARARAGG